MLKIVFKSFTCIVISFFLVTMCTLPATAQQDSTADYMQVPGPLTFDNTTYHLAWSSKPTDNYFKQQYLAHGDSMAHYSKMLVMDILIDTIKPKSLVYYKLNSLAQRKKVDAITDYHLIQSPDSTQYIVDFVQSEGSPAGSYVEWNAYLYKAFKDANGHKGVLLFGISMRAYGDKAEDFMGKLRDTREEVIGQLMKYQLPAAKVNS